MNSHNLQAEATRLGFSSIGFARAQKLDEEARRLETWLNQGSHGKMAWMENHFDLRIDPSKLVPGAKSVIVLSYNYFTQLKQSDAEAPKISRYAYGEDYHTVIKEKLRELIDFMRGEYGNFEGRSFVDSAPVLERTWAERAGIGWNGRNTLTINPHQGSYFFLATIICDLEFEYSDPIRDHCGTCRRCIEACPTEAISPQGYLLDASKCISYLTIELREAIPEEFKGRMDNWMFGCDVCQEVCPWNRFAEPTSEPRFQPALGLLDMTRKEWLELTEEVFGRLFKGSAVKRAKFAGLTRNLNFLRRDGER